MGISAKVIKHSKVGEEDLITIELELHRFILSQFNTHRSISKNAQSSRAIPVTRQLEQIETDPAMPLFYGKAKSGMVAAGELDVESKQKAEEIILGMRDYCVDAVGQLAELGLSKEIANRYVEPFMWTKGVATATKEAWQAMLALRLHKDAQPEFQALAKEIDRAILNSRPDELDVGHFHLPYVQTAICQDTGEQYYYDTNGSEISLKDAIKVSVSCCAQVSYRNLDTSLDKAHKIYNMLNLPVNGEYPDDPAHFSPAEHVARVLDCREWYDFTAGGNFVTMCFWQYRKALESGTEEKFLRQ